MKHFAFEYKSGRLTTTGESNKSTGQYSIAGQLMTFDSDEKRDAWVDLGEFTSDMGGNCRKKVTAKTARALHRGMTMEEFEGYIDIIQFI
jgi:hypothetical protein